PTEDIIDISTSLVGAERTQSLEFRMVNADALFERAMKRPMFGWGNYCRACIFDPVSGEIESVRDGAWIITFGGRGAINFLFVYGLIAISILLMRRKLRRIPGETDR